MAMAFLTFIGTLFLLVLTYVLVLVAIRRRYGTRQQNLFNAILQATLGMLLDGAMLYFSIAFCTASASDALRLRGRGTQNQLLMSFTGIFGAGNVDNATLWGIIVPALSWAAAHVVVVLGLLLTRCSYQTISGWRALRAARAADIEPEETVKAGTERAALGVLACAALLPLAIYAFRAIVQFDMLLVRYQIIHSSKALTKALGKDWMASLTEEKLVAKLGSSFLGQIVIHAGTFYVVALLVAAFLLTVALHNLLHHVNALPRREYRPTPPPLDLPSGVWNGGPVVVAPAGVAFAGPATAGVQPEPVTFAPASTQTPTMEHSASGADAGLPRTQTPEPPAAPGPAVEIPLQAPPQSVAEAEAERVSLMPSE